MLVSIPLKVTLRAYRHALSSTLMTPGKIISYLLALAVKVTILLAYHTAAVGSSRL